MINTIYSTLGLIFLFLFSAFCSFSQTKRIAFRSHSGKAKEFTVREEGNFGEIAPYYNYPKPEKKSTATLSEEKAKADSLAHAKIIAEAKAKQDSLVFAQKEAIKKHNEEVLKNKKMKKTEKVKSGSSAIEKITPAIQANLVSISNVKVFPNPFSEQTNVLLKNGQDQQVVISVLNLEGKKISALCNKRLIAGDYQFKWNAPDVPQGIYILHAVIGGYVYTAKVVKK